ncbi:hypothetical protein AB5J62_23020 [Amycolatopsis sp. cg5]|uniref:hypothetical protein n=1 Tax=Amycolatopsis sp. cg5 TaxID=3238802 RepID=UPI0035267D57
MAISTSGDTDLDRPVAVHPLTFLDEGDEVTVGRADIDAYCVLPADGAELLRRLAEGMSPRAAAAWYADNYGEPVDVVEFVEAMRELEFLAEDGKVAVDSGPVRWQRLGAAVFSPAAWICYGALIVAAVVVSVREPSLAPHYRNLFFTDYMLVLELGLTLGQLPFIIFHEGAHALAGRRLGLRTKMRIGRRLYFVVVETSLDGLVTVPRARRYLPMLAGMFADVVACAVLTLLAALVRHDGVEPQFGRVCLALAFACVLRFVWQFYLYLQTDVYHVISTVLGCVDLQKTAREMISNRIGRLFGREPVDETAWHHRDRAVARWYSWLLFGGYAVLLGTLALVGLPSAIRIFGTVFGRLVAADTSGWTEVADSIVFLALTVAQFAVPAVLALRERARRKRSKLTHVID